MSRSSSGYSSVYGPAESSIVILDLEEEYTKDTKDLFSFPESQRNPMYQNTNVKSVFQHPLFDSHRQFITRTDIGPLGCVSTSTFDPYPLTFRSRQQRQFRPVVQPLNQPISLSAYISQSTQSKMSQPYSSGQEKEVKQTHIKRDGINWTYVGEVALINYQME